MATQTVPYNRATLQSISDTVRATNAEGLLIPSRGTVGPAGPTGPAGPQGPAGTPG